MGSSSRRLLYQSTHSSVSATPAPAESCVLSNILAVRVILTVSFAELAKEAPLN